MIPLQEVMNHWWENYNYSVEKAQSKEYKPPSANEIPSFQEYINDLTNFELLTELSDYYDSYMRINEKYKE